MHIFASPHFCVIRYLGDRIMDMNAYLSAHGLDQTAQYGKEILLALNSEEKQIAEVIAYQQAQEVKFNLLFEQLENLDVTMKAGVSEALSQDTAALVRQFALELKIDRSEVREALEEIQGSVGKELGGVLDALSSLDAQVIGG
jgi:hypothetical protein